MAWVASSFCFVRKALLCFALVLLGYLLGNAFPTFEVVPYGYQKMHDPMGFIMEEPKDFDDDAEKEVK